MSLSLDSDNCCTSCGSKAKVEKAGPFGVKDLLQIVYCPKCETFQSVMPELFACKGIAQRGINKKTGEFRLRIEKPEEHSKRDIIVRTFPQIILTKPSEFHASGRRIYKTKERTARAYPELKRGDEVIVAGFMAEGAPLVSVVMENLTVAMLWQFIDSHIKLKKGFMSSFTIENPILNKAETLIKEM